MEALQKCGSLGDSAAGFALGGERRQPRHRAGSSPGPWAPMNSPSARLFLQDKCFGSLWAVFGLLLASQTCKGLMTGYRLEPQTCRNVVREGFVSPAPCPSPGQPGGSGGLLVFSHRSSVCPLRSLGHLVLSSLGCCSQFTAGNVLSRHRRHFS